MQEPVKIVITVEGGVVGSVICTVPAKVTLIDFDDIEAGGDIANWDYDGQYTANEIAEAMKAGEMAVASAKESAAEMAQEGKKSKYVQQGGCRCPYCDSEDIEGGAFESDVGYVNQQVCCHNCSREWHDIYRLSAVHEENN